MAALTQAGFLASVWTFTTIALLLTIGRYAIRIGAKTQFRIQDFTHGCAIIFLLGLESYYSYFFPLLAKVHKYSIKQGPTPSREELNTYVRGVVALEFLFWVVLYMVKFTFMFTYRDIFWVSRKFRIAWWIVMAYLIITFPASFLTVLWTCGSPSELFVLQQCFSKSAQNTVDNYAETCVALNIFGDLAIMVLPLWMLRGLQMQTAQKIGTSFMFLFSWAIIAFDAARIAVGAGGGAVSMATLWDSLEPAVAVIVGALPTYRVLFTNGSTWSSKYFSRFRSGLSSRNSKSNKTPKSYEMELSDRESAPTSQRYLRSNDTGSFENDVEPLRPTKMV